MEDHVSSEVHMFADEAAIRSEDGVEEAGVETDSQADNKVLCLAKFTFHVPDYMDHVPSVQDPEYDSDGDLNVSRAVSKRREEVLMIEHAVSTTLSDVGCQVWRGSLVLADYLLYISNQLKDVRVLEVGAGTGLASIIAAFCGARVTATDVDSSHILDLIIGNIKRNRHLISDRETAIHVRALSFENDLSAALASETDDIGMVNVAENDLVLAGDIIYDDRITDLFVDNFLLPLLVQRCAKSTGGEPQKQKKRILLSMEKRYVFTTTDLDTVAPAYNHFMARLDEVVNKLDKLGLNYQVEFIDIDFEQFFCYERSEHMVLIQMTF